MTAPAVSPSQARVLDLVIQGKMTKQIAHELGLSPRTVETHRRDAAARLGTRSGYHAVVLWDRMQSRASAEPRTGDMRQGVTPIQHAVLDLVEQKQRYWDDNSIVELIDALKCRVGSMSMTTSMEHDLHTAIEACALLITIAERSNHNIAWFDANIVRIAMTGDAV